MKYFSGKGNGRMTNEIKCVLSIKESNSNAKKGPNFHIWVSVFQLRLEMEPNTPKSAQMQMRKISNYNLPVNEVDAGPVSCCLPPSFIMSCKQKN